MELFEMLQLDDKAAIIRVLKSRDINEEILGSSLLLWAVYQGNLPFVQTLVQLGADINKRDQYGRTALEIACYFGFYDITFFLVNSGANIELKCLRRSEMGWNNNKHHEIFDLLLKHLDVQKS